MNHWENVYASKPAGSVSWFQTRPETSLAMIADTGLGSAAAVIDVGAGASTLLDHLLERGYADVTVMDLSDSALRISRERLGSAADGVQWIAADLLEHPWPAARWDIWHDRAVFHFLTAAEDRARYLEHLRRALKMDGQVILATFAEDGPDRCSGLPVARYDAAGLARELGEGFELLDARRELHLAPGGSRQSFVYTRFRRSKTG